MDRKRKKLSRFWLIYAIAATVLLIAVFAGLVLFYDFIDAFEESQPQSPSDAAKEYASKLTEEDIRNMLTLEADKLTWGSEESRDRTINDYVEAWKAGGIFCRKSGGEDDSPVYSVVASRREICRIALAKTPTGRYGFDTWTVTDTYVSFEGFTKYSVTVPAGSSLTVNGKLLDESYIVKRDIPYSTSSVEAGVVGLPTAVTYETELLDAQPTVSANLGEHELSFTYADSTYTAEYPTSLLCSATVKVPAGSTVTVRGISLADHFEKITESAFGGLIAEGLVVPAFDIYTIEGLYATLEDIKITLNGEPLEFANDTANGVQSITVDIGGVNDEAVSTFADTFTRAYFHYTSSGYRNIDANLATALSYVLEGSELYTRIRDSKIGYDFVTPVTSQVYNRLEVVRMYRLEDGSYVVKLAFDVDHMIYSESRSYKGEISLHIVNVGTYKIANMVIEND